MRAYTFFSAALVTLISASLWTACSADNGDNAFGDGGAGGDGAGSGTGTGGDLGFTSTSGSGGGILQHEPACEGDHSNTDSDGDGYTGAQGDCNDCTPQMNPGAYDYAGNNIDEDCNGAPDDTPLNCDGAIALDAPDPMDGARAMGLCKQSVGEGWGVVSAAWVRSDGQPLAPPLDIGKGVLNGFGPNVKPQEGSKLLALSSGSARQPSDPGYSSVGGFWKDFNPHGPAPGYPKESPSCPGVITGEPYDSAGLRVDIKAPTNAKSFHFNLDFYTYEFPGYICSTFNDYFVALLTPMPANQTDGNISFDSQGNTLSVNAGFLEVCSPQMAGGKNFPCVLGPSELTGTGYDEQVGGSAATGWLQTSSPVVEPGGTISLHFAIWDSGDGILDSTVLLDNFTFDVDETATETTPIPDPK